jgi:predicted SAM-dependent methyltransferase
MIPFIHISRKEQDLFNRWIAHTKGLGNMPELVVWTEPGVKIDHPIDRVIAHNLSYPEVANRLFHEACNVIREPLLWLEADAWPVAINWFDAIDEEYRRLGRPAIMLSASHHPPHDIYCGIGVYAIDPPEWGEFSKYVGGQGFDKWAGDLGEGYVKRTPLIRHSYGIYRGGEVVGFHAFYSRSHFQQVCGGAAIFHKDPLGTSGQWVDSPAAAVTGATPRDMSETSKHRDWFLPYTQGHGMDVGFGGDALTTNCITFDMPQPYTSVGTSAQHLGGDARKIPLKNDTLDWLYNSHLIEDFTYGDQIPMVQEWLRVLKPGGKLLILAPDQQRFLAHCAATGQSINDNHKEADYSRKTFKKRVLKTGNIRARVAAEEDFTDYSWGIVLEKNL